MEQWISWLLHWFINYSTEIFFIHRKYNTLLGNSWKWIYFVTLTLMKLKRVSLGLGGCFALAEDSENLAQLTAIHNSSSWVPNVFFWKPGTPDIHTVYIHSFKQTLITQRYKQINLKRRWAVKIRLSIGRFITFVGIHPDLEYPKALQHLY